MYVCTLFLYIYIYIYIADRVRDSCRRCVLIHLAAFVYLGLANRQGIILKSGNIAYQTSLMLVWGDCPGVTWKGAERKLLDV